MFWSENVLYNYQFSQTTAVHLYLYCTKLYLVTFNFSCWFMMIVIFNKSNELTWVASKWFFNWFIIIIYIACWWTRVWSLYILEVVFFYLASISFFSNTSICLMTVCIKHIIGHSYMLIHNANSCFVDVMILPVTISVFAERPIMCSENKPPQNSLNLWSFNVE